MPFRVNGIHSAHSASNVEVREQSKVMSIRVRDSTADFKVSERCMGAISSMLINIVESACEHENDLNLTRLINFMDLYRAYLSHSAASEATVSNAWTGTMAFASFEQFISDISLLDTAANAASRDYGVAVATPAPLKHSANSPAE